MIIFTPKRLLRVVFAWIGWIAKATKISTLGPTGTTMILENVDLEESFHTQGNRGACVFMVVEIHSIRPRRFQQARYS
jgi:hypothetical protein